MMLAGSAAGGYRGGLPFRSEFMVGKHETGRTDLTSG